MSVKVEEMIYIQDDRILFTPYLKEYDITDYIQELTEELSKLKER
ncbi:hypothetical protein [Streptococcus suis]|nr:hypothetical protein [Streptococcus suis]